MHREEWNELTECVDCGASIAPATDRAFALTEDAFLCFECAIGRGGVYDDERERWSELPHAHVSASEWT